jgi:hypothetical protein
MSLARRRQRAETGGSHDKFQTVGQVAEYVRARVKK